MSGEKILLGITGGIAAYKSAYLVRRLRETGAQVRVVMTPAAQAFITPLTLQALSGNPVRTDLLDPAAEAGMGHIELARWADRVLVAPASADFMARLVHGMADDLLATLCLATTAPVVLAPAMNQQMWLNPATQANRDLLIRRGVRLLGPAEGEQACGETGPGRMLEPDVILEQLGRISAHRELFQGVRVLITAGPTREPLDPVRYISNRSSGRMGYAVAEALAGMGADVCLVSGPVNLAAPGGVELLAVETALQMHGAVMERAGDVAIFVATAAVADYRAAHAAERKIKKTESTDALEISLVKNPDILADVAALSDGPFTVGFAAETHNVETYARDKLQRKGLDMIAANRVGGPEGGFERTDNALSVIWSDGQQALPMMSKPDLAQQLALLIAERYHAKTGA